MARKRKSAEPKAETADATMPPFRKRYRAKVNIVCASGEYKPGDLLDELDAEEIDNLERQGPGIVEEIAD